MRSHPYCPKLPRSGIALLAVVGLTLGTGAFRPAASAPALTPPGRTGLGAQWLVASLSDAGLLPSPTDPSQPSPTTTAQAVSALVAAGGRSAAVDLMLDALAPLVDDIATEGGTDSAGGLGALIGAVVAGGRDARAFGTPPQDLVARLRAMQRPDGLFGLADPTYDGAYRQGLALLGLAAVGETDADGLDWLEEQQCPTGLWVSYRPDPTAPCPPADADTYTGPDSNSSALAVMALVAHGRSDSAQRGAAALEAVRAADGGWSFIPGTALATDSVSTALVALALRMARGAPDGEGLTALDAFQVGCEGPEADRGGVGYQPGVDGSLVPDAGATTAAVLAYSGTALPVDGAVGPLPAAPCSQPVPAPTSSPTTDAPTTTTAPTLPRTGTSGLPVALGLLGLGLGSVLVFLGRRR